MKTTLFSAFVVAVLAASVPTASAASLNLVIRNGKVSLDAQDVTLRQILAEWARVGKTKIVNLEQVTSGPVTIKLDGVPEQEALDIVLRAVPGYVAAPRVTPVADASMFDRVMIMATTTRVADLPRSGQGFGPLGAGATQLRPAFPMPGQQPAMPGSPADEGNVNIDSAIAAAAAAGLITTTPAMPTPIMPGPLQPPSRLGGPGQQPAPPPQTAPAPTNPWNAPTGAAVPGMPTPAPPAATPQTTGRGALLPLPRPPQADQ